MIISMKQIKLQLPRFTIYCFSFHNLLSDINCIRLLIKQYLSREPHIAAHINLYIKHC